MKNDSMKVFLVFIVLAHLDAALVRGKKHRRPAYCKDLIDKDNGSFLWLVKRDPPSYFFGTIHVPHTRVWEFIPENTIRAFHMSDQVFFELDLTDPHTISALTSCQLLPKGRSLSDILPNELYFRLKRHLEYVKSQMSNWMTPDQRGRGLYADYLFNAITGNWERKGPVWVMLMVNSLTKGDIRSRGIAVLDLYLAQLAERYSKGTGAVERVEEQCVPLNGLNFSQVVFALNQTLVQQEHLRAGFGLPPYTTDDLIKHYNCGDLNPIIFSQDTVQVPRFGNASLAPSDATTADHIDNYFRQELIYRRNRRMGLRVVDLLTKNPYQSFFFAFGAGHFLGNYTVLDVIQENGFVVEPIDPDQRLKRFLSEQHSSVNGRKLVDTDGIVNKGQLNPRYSATTVTPRRSSPFNDLWVKIDPQPESGSFSFSSEVPPADAELVEKSIRIWYGLPTNGGKVASSNFFIINVAICFFFFN